MEARLLKEGEENGPHFETIKHVIALIYAQAQNEGEQVLLITEQVLLNAVFNSSVKTHSAARDTLDTMFNRACAGIDAMYAAGLQHSIPAMPGTSLN